MIPNHKIKSVCLISSLNCDKDKFRQITKILISEKTYSFDKVRLDDICQIKSYESLLNKPKEAISNRNSLFWFVYDYVIRLSLL